MQNSKCIGEMNDYWILTIGQVLGGTHHQKRTQGAGHSTPDFIQRVWTKA